jgi:glucose-1-phosphate cytidylyltransferase
MQTVIFAGGLGTRFSEKTHLTPKPLIKVGDEPIIVHIMKIYAQQGHTDFIIAGGYKVEEIKKYFIDAMHSQTDLEINFSNDSIISLSSNWLIDLGVTIKIIDTGLHTQTGSRLLRLSEHLNTSFMLTYGDGLGNIDLSKLEETHLENKSLITISGVKPKSRYGKLISDGNKIQSFIEKPRFDTELVNAGFMMVQKKFLELIPNEFDVMIEDQPFKSAIKMGRMHVHEHNGFWHPMDTLRDQRKLNDLIENNQMPWLKL